MPGPWPGGGNMDCSRAGPSFVEVDDTVVGVVAGSPSLEEREITPAAALQRDPGVVSIDLLDVVLRLERAFPTPIPRGERFPDSMFQAGAVVDDGRVTDAGMSELRARRPFAALYGVEQDRRASSVPGLLTVGLLARSVARWPPAQAPSLAPPADDGSGSSHGVAS